MTRKSDKLRRRLKALREASRLICKRVLEKRSDVIAIYVVGSVAVGNIHEKSDVDMMVLIEQGDDFEGENLQVSGCSVDISYVPLRLWKEELYDRCGSAWEVEVASLMDSLVLYDPNGLIQKTKKEFEAYPEEKRGKGVREIREKMTNFGEAVWYHWLNKNYDIESIFSKLYAMQALRILFPLNRVYVRGDKFIFEQIAELEEKPSDYQQKCLSLLWFKSQGVNHDEATWIINTVSETAEDIEGTLQQQGLDILPTLRKGDGANTQSERSA